MRDQPVELLAQARQKDRQLRRDEAVRVGWTFEACDPGGPSEDEERIASDFEKVGRERNPRKPNYSATRYEAGATHSLSAESEGRLLAMIESYEAERAQRR
jgi:hypothetical protein